MSGSPNGAASDAAVLTFAVTVESKLAGVEDAVKRNLAAVGMRTLSGGFRTAVRRLPDGGPAAQADRDAIRSAHAWAYLRRNADYRERKATRNALTDRGPAVSLKRHDGSNPLALSGLRHMGMRQCSP